MSKKLPSTKTGRKRLLKLADLLDANANNKKGAKFDYGFWGGVDNRGQQPQMTCNTTGCALGLAAISGKFKHLTATVHPDDFGITMNWNGNKIEAVNAAKRLFEITHDEANDLFCRMKLRTNQGAKAERQCAANIRHFVEGKKFKVID